MPRLCFAQLMLYKAYFSTFQSLCQVSQEEILYEAHIFSICRVIHDSGQFSQMNAPGVSFPSRQCIHMNTLLPHRGFSPLPRKTTFRWWNYVEFGEVRVVWRRAFWDGWCCWGVVLLLCEGTCQKERRSSHLPQHINQCRPRHETRASRLILCYYVKSSGGCAALDAIRLDCGGEMYSPEYTRFHMG